MLKRAASGLLSFGESMAVDGRRWPMFRCYYSPRNFPIWNKCLLAAIAAEMLPGKYSATSASRYTSGFGLRAVAVGGTGEECGWWVGIGFVS